MKSPIKPPILLKTILDILFWVTLVGLIGKILFTAFYFFSDIPSDIRINDYEVKEFSPALVSGILIYIIYLLRKIVRSFFKRKLFTPLQIRGLKSIGQLIIIATLAEVVLDFFLKLSVESRASAGLNFNTSFSSFWFTLALGLFFILLSKSFRYARSLQEENELTV